MASRPCYYLNRPCVPDAVGRLARLSYRERVDEAIPAALRPLLPPPAEPFFDLRDPDIGTRARTLASGPPVQAHTDLGLIHSRLAVGAAGGGAAGALAGSTAGGARARSAAARARCRRRCCRRTCRRSVQRTEPRGGGRAAHAGRARYQRRIPFAASRRDRTVRRALLRPSARFLRMTWGGTGT
jgi:hypothetical protein